MAEVRSSVKFKAEFNFFQNEFIPSLFLNQARARSPMMEPLSWNCWTWSILQPRPWWTSHAPRMLRWAACVFKYVKVEIFWRVWQSYFFPAGLRSGTAPPLSLSWLLSSWNNWSRMWRRVSTLRPSSERSEVPPTSLSTRSKRSLFPWRRTTGSTCSVLL